MNKPLALFLILAALAAGWFAARLTPPASSAGAHDHAAAAPAVYQCPMHPWIKSDKPDAKCTICGMALVAATGNAGAGQAADPNLVTLTPAQAAVTGVRTAAVRTGPLVRTLRVNGVIDDDDTAHRFITAYAAGRIEKLHVNFVGAEVRAGEPLLTLYSPDLLVARQEFHALSRQKAVAKDLLSASREKLRQLGLQDGQIDALASADAVSPHTEVLAPLSGTVITRNVEAAYEGGYVESGLRLFELGDFSRLWFWFDAYEPDLAVLRPGLEVEVAVPSQPGLTFKAPVDFIDPNLDEMTRTARVRVVLDNPGRRILHRQTAHAVVRLDTPEVLLVPRGAVLRHRGRPVVFVDQGNHNYVSRDVRLGRIGDTDIEVLGGVRAGDKVVTEGALILDGQAELAHAAVGGGHDHDGAAAAPVAAHEEAGYALLKALAFASADAADALASDDLAGYQSRLPALRDATATYFAGFDAAKDGPLAKHKDSFADGRDLDAARRAFEPFSTTLADLARAEHLHHKEKLWIYQCPMTPVLGKGRWLAREHKLRNPFFGSAMLECGEEIN
jgi:Cu(I)/Ag(I) efflux system membrane fusion protein